MLPTPYQIVQQYGALDHHRTGTESDQQTLRWYEALMQELGSVERVPFSFPRYDAQCKVMVSNQVVSSLPLYYQSLGQEKHDLFEETNVAVKTVEIEDDEKRVWEKIEKHVVQARESGSRALVLGTRCTTDSLYGINVSPEKQLSMPVLLVPGDIDLVSTSNVIKVDYSARLVSGTSFNLLGRFGDKNDSDPLVITTPISGWFGCAGERGTGLALALLLAERISTNTSVELVVTSGHELGYLGGFHHVNQMKSAPRGVLHIGSCVGAASNAERNALTTNMQVTTNIAERNIETGEGRVSAIDKMQELFHEIDLDITRPLNPKDRTGWVGESECWAHFDCPMLSIAGANDLFHTPEDCPNSATSPALLEKMFSVLWPVAELFVDEVRKSTQH